MTYYKHDDLSLPDLLSKFPPPATMLILLALLALVLGVLVRGCLHVLHV